MHLENIHSLSDSTLMDMLAAYTEEYTKMIIDRNMQSQEFFDCKLMVKYLQQEIEARRNPEANSLFLQDP